jgi:hypothetical protein
MAYVFQYGSNLSSKRLNSADRLRGDAEIVGNALTKNRYELVFDIESRNGYAVSSIQAGVGRRLWGVIYNVPDHLISRASAEAHDRKSLDAIEAAGVNYQRVPIALRWPNGRPVGEPVETYVGIGSAPGIETSCDYVQHILEGLREHRIPSEYVAYVKARILASNPRLQPNLFRSQPHYWLFLARRFWSRVTSGRDRRP